MVDAVAARYAIPLKRGTPARSLWEDVSYWYSNDVSNDHLVAELGMLELTEMTGVKATAMAFARYCRVAVLEAKEAESSGRGGPNHRGLLQVLNALELQFQLAPGKRPKVQPASASAPPVGALARFRS